MVPRVPKVPFRFYEKIDNTDGSKGSEGSFFIFWKNRKYRWFQGFPGFLHGYTIFIHYNYTFSSCYHYCWSHLLWWNPVFQWRISRIHVCETYQEIMLKLLNTYQNGLEVFNSRAPIQIVRVMGCSPRSQNYRIANTECVHLVPFVTLILIMCLGFSTVKLLQFHLTFSQ